FFSSRRRHTRSKRDWSSDVCSSDLVAQIDLRARVYPFFRRLAAEVGETVHLGVLQKTSVVYLDKVEPNRRVCMSSKIGTSNPVRSEERRVGKECRSLWSQDHEKKKG